MHDPLVVAFSIRRPWPSWPPRDVRGPVPEGCNPNPRWDWGYRWHRSNPRRRGLLYWRPSAFMTLAGWRFYFPSLVTVWHREPGGADSGEVCSHWKRDPAGKLLRDGNGHAVIDSSWRWHVRHWRIQLHPLQALRRWALTRCAWCGGRSRKGDVVNLSHSWDGPRGRWWQGERGLFHHWCSSAEVAWRTCTCAIPLLPVRPDGSRADHGKCESCGRFRKWRLEPWQARQAEDWRRDVPYGEHPTREAHERAVATYEAAKAVRRVEDQVAEWRALAQGGQA